MPRGAPSWVRSQAGAHASQAGARAAVRARVAIAPRTHVSLRALGARAAPHLVRVGLGLGARGRARARLR
eukprot:scaffold52465_cov45-Phaeocystis_antarctica.AAC.1